MDTAFTLGPYAARNCPVRVQNRFDPTIPPVDENPDVDPTSSTARHRTAVLNQLVGFATEKEFRIVDLRGLELDERLEATIAAVDAGVDIIVAPNLPLDWAGHRSGSPDVLSRYGVTPSGTSSYLPIQIKRHLVLSNQQSSESLQALSCLCAPVYSESQRLPWTKRNEQIIPDLIQLAHYHRHLEALGWAADITMAGLIGTDRLTVDEDPACAQRCVTWVDLSECTIPSMLENHPGEYLLYSPLARYDHDFALRVETACVASKRTDASAPPAIRPIHTDECSHCPWWETCMQQLDPSDLSLAIDKSPLDAEEIRALRSLGVLSVPNLANADMDSLLSNYLPQVPHRHDADQRLLLARRRAEMLTNGIILERTSTDPITVPRAPLEIDFDIETSRAGHVYLWGFLLSTPGDTEPPEYRPFVRLRPMSTASEGDLAAEALEWLVNVLEENPGSLVFHYSDYEIRHIARFEHLCAAQKLLGMRDRFFDLFQLVQQHYFGVHGIGLKQMAAHGSGFVWRDEHPNGLSSQMWFDEAVGNADEHVRIAMAQRVMQYNEDDTRATRALREWLSNGGVVQPQPDIGD